MCLVAFKVITLISVSGPEIISQNFENEQVISRFAFRTLCFLSKSLSELLTFRRLGK